jgi:hypothetical protein
LLVLIATTGTNGLYKPRLKAFFPPVITNQKKNPLKVSEGLGTLNARMISNAGTQGITVFSP